MPRIACVSLCVLTLAVACSDDASRRPDDPVAPAVSLVTDDPGFDTSSTVCRAYAREYAALRAAKDSGALDARARQRSAALNAVIADACR